jgi:hypothetical protein
MDVRRLKFETSAKCASKELAVGSSSTVKPTAIQSKVSIIITTYNRSAIVSNAIESALRQTYSDYELIVIDDGSTDNTREHLERYLARIRYVYQANRGVSAARNAGANLAGGEWIAFLDSDDVWQPTKLERQLSALASLGSEFGACFTDCDYLGNPAFGGTVFEATGLKTESAFGPLREVSKFLREDTYAMCVQSLLVLRSVFNDVAGFDESLDLGEDRELIFRLSFRTKFCYVSSPMVSIDRSASRSRLTDLCSRRDDAVCARGELLRKKMLGHPEFVDLIERKAIEDELIGLYYGWAAARTSDLRLASAWKVIAKLRMMKQSLPSIFWRLLSRTGRKILRTVWPKLSERVEE